MIESQSATRHSIHNARADGHMHYGWSNAFDPILEVEPGHEVFFNVSEASGGILDARSTAADLEKLTLDVVNPVTGPVVVKGARAGQTLAVDILCFGASQWGWTALIPGFGLLADSFDEPVLEISTVHEHTVDFLGGIRLPRRAFCGTMGVAPAEPGTHSIVPPRAVGGNMDIRHLGTGATLYLPIEVDGALFSVGDSHAAQGDGEVCGTAIESPIDVTLKFALCDRSIKAPQYRFGPGSRVPDAAGYYATTGVAPDLMDAARQSVSAMIDHLCAEHAMRPEHAYMLCSVAADMSISEIVDMPNWIVSLHMPLSIFG